MTIGWRRESGYVNVTLSVVALSVLTLSVVNLSIKESKRPEGRDCVGCHERVQGKDRERRKGYRLIPSTLDVHEGSLIVLVQGGHCHCRGKREEKSTKAETTEKGKEKVTANHAAQPQAKPSRNRAARLVGAKINQPRFEAGSAGDKALCTQYFITSRYH